MPWRRKGRANLRLVVDKTGPAPRTRQRRRRPRRTLLRRLDATVRRRAIPLVALAAVGAVAVYVENPDWSPTAASCPAGTHTGEVTHVRDGDTIEVGGLPIRLSGLARDCPRYSGGRYREAEREAARNGATIGRSYRLPGYC